MEIVGSRPTTVYMTNHYGTAADPRQIHVAWNGPDFSAGFHTYGVDWEPRSITWYVDGVRRFRTTTNIPATPMYMMVTLAVGGDFPGPPGRDHAVSQRAEGRVCPCLRARVTPIGHDRQLSAVEQGRGLQLPQTQDQDLARLDERASRCAGHKG